jgi:hypothetical protein
MDTAILRDCLERANDFNGDRSARVMRIEAKDREAVASAGIRVRERKQQYLFSRNTYVTRAGIRLHTVRRNVARVDALPDVDVAPYVAAYQADCLKLLHGWQHEHKQRHGSSGGFGATKRMLGLAGSLPEEALSGQVILVGGKLVGFAFGGRLRPGFAYSK